MGLLGGGPARGSSRTAGGGGGGLLGGDGGGSKKQKQREAKKLVEQLFKGDRGGGFGGLLREAGGLMRSAPSSVMTIGKDFGVELVNRGKGMAEGLDDIVGGVASGDFGEALGGAGDVFYNFPANPQKIVVGFGRGLVGGGDDPGKETPLATGFGQSFRRTGERIGATNARLAEAGAHLVTGHPGQAAGDLGDIPYVKAFNEGRLIGEVVEDAGNVAIVAGAAAKGLSAASKGALQKAATERAIAKNLSSAAANLERDLAKAEATVAANEEILARQTAAAAERAAAKGMPEPTDFVQSPELRTQMVDATAHRDALRTTLEEQVRPRIAEAEANADALIANTAKPLQVAHRMADMVERFGNQGANVPFKPFEWGAKAAPKVVKQFLKYAPDGLSDALGKVGDIAAVEKLRQAAREKGLTRGVRRTTDEIIQGQVAQTEALLHPIYSALEDVHRLTNADADLFHAMLLDLTQSNVLFAEGLDGFRRSIAGAPDAAAAVDALLERTRQMPGVEATRAALDLSLTMAEYRSLATRLAEAEAFGGDTTAIRASIAALERRGVTPELMARVDQAQEILRARVLEPIEARYVEFKGSPTAPTEGAVEWRQDRTTANNPDPVGRGRVEQAHDAEQAAGRQAVVDARARVDRAAAGMDNTPEQMRDARRTAAADLDITRAKASDLVRRALSDPEVMREVLLDLRMTDAVVVDSFIPARIAPDGTPVEAVAVFPDGTRRTVPEGTRIISVDEFDAMVTRYVDKATTSTRIAHRYPMIGRTAQEARLAGHSGLRVRGTDAPSFAPLERATAKLAKAAEQSAEANRLRVRAEQLKAGEPKVVAQAVKAAEKVVRFRERAAAAAEAGARARAEIAARAQMPEAGALPDHMLDSAEYRARHGAVDPHEGTVLRFHGAGQDAAAVAAEAASRPQGLYLTTVTDPAAAAAGHPYIRYLVDEAGAVPYRFTPSATNPLDLPPTEGAVAGRTTPGGLPIELDAGVTALKRIVGDDEFARLADPDGRGRVDMDPSKAGRERILDDIQARYGIDLREHAPNGDYYDQVSALGGHLAREQGFDAIRVGDEYVALRPEALTPVAPTPDTLPGTQAPDYRHSEVVATAMEAGEAVPPWVVDEYRPWSIPKRPENTLRQTHWDPFTGAAVTKRAKRYEQRLAEVQRHNAAIASNPNVVRIQANARGNGTRWANTNAGKAYNAALAEVKELRAAIHAAAKAEIRALGSGAWSALPDDVAYYPGGIAGVPDVYADLLGDLGVRADWSIIDRMDEMQAAGGRWKNAGPDDWVANENLWNSAYNQAWADLPDAVKKENGGMLARLSEQEVRALYRKWRRNELGVDELGLDSALDEFWSAQSGAKAEIADRAQAEASFVDAVGRRARLGRIEKSGVGNGWTRAELDAFFAATTDPELLALRDDPVVLGALQEGTQDSAARALYEGRLGDAATLDLPPQSEWAHVFETYADAEQAVYAAFGDQVAAEEFLTRWYRAGEPDLEAAIASLADGVVPEWVDPRARQGLEAVTRAERRARAAQRVDQYVERQSYPVGGARVGQPGRAKLTPLERRLYDENVAAAQAVNPEGAAARAVARGGSATVDRLATQAENRAARTAASAADIDLSALRDEAANSALRPGVTEQFVRHGRQLERWRRELRGLKIAEERLGPNGTMTQRQVRELARYDADIANAPARYRKPLAAYRDGLAAAANQLYEEYLAAGVTDPVILSALNDLHVDGMRTLADVTEAFHSEAGGRLVPNPRFIDPTYVPGGKLHTGSSSGTGAVSPRLRAGPAEKPSRTGLLPASTEEMAQNLTKRISLEVRNTTARQLQAHFGVRINQVLGEERAQTLAEEYAINAKRANETMIAEMGEQGYVPWNPRRSLPEHVNRDALGSFVMQADDAALTTSTLWVPKEVTEQFQVHFAQSGAVDAWFRKWWDRPTNTWKAGVLAFSPRWHVNNIVGNFIMATVGAGISPTDWARSMRDAYAVVKGDELRFRAEHGLAAETRLGRGIDRLRGGVEKRAARAEARVARIDPDVAASMLGPDGMSIDPRIPQRGAGAAALDPIHGPDLKQRGFVRQKLHNAAQRSYAFNGFVDDLNRIAVYMEKYRTMTERDIATFAAAHPSLLSIKGDLGAMRREGAVRMSLDALGDFRKMNPLERQVVRRIIPFYTWIRHITKLAVRLPRYAPVRVAWLLHLADMYGEPPEFGLLAGALPLGADKYLQLPRGNPFEDVLVLPTTGNPGQVVKSALSAVGPWPRVAAGLAGYDTRKLAPFKRPPGSGPTDEYGNPEMGPLNWLQAIRFAADQVPQARLGVLAFDEIKYGSPRLRYPTGEPYKTSRGETIPAGRSLLGEVAALSGVPYPRNIDVPSIESARDARLRQRQAARDRYNRTPTRRGGSGGSGTRKKSGSRGLLG